MSWFDEQFSKLINDMQSTVKPMLGRIRSEGKADFQEIVNKAEFVIGRAVKVEDAIAILDKMHLIERTSLETKAQIEEAKAILDELKKDIANDLINIKQQS